MITCPYCKIQCFGSFKVASRHYFHCTDCSLIFNDSKAHYNEFILKYSFNYFDQNLQEEVQNKRKKLYETIIDQIEKINIRGRLLDVGAGCGFFCKYAMKRGWNVSGVDPSYQSVERAENSGIPVFVGTIHDCILNDFYDAISFINVLDQIALPWKDIQKAVSLLKTGGIIFIRFPNGYLHSTILLISNILGCSATIQKYLVFHQYSFTPKFIKNLLNDQGFSSISIINSPPSSGDPNKLFMNDNIADIFKFGYFLFAQLLYIISAKRLLIAPSLNAIATKNKSRTTVSSL